VAKLTPAEYLRQVRVEAIDKVSWPTRRETVSTAIMVVIMTSVLAIFFFGVDALFSTVVKFLLGFLA
jgi:preprotein translocase subunit SecE